METVIPSAKVLKNRPREEIKRILMLAGFRPVKKGELPEKGDRVINCNALYGTYGSNTTFQSGVVEPSNYEPYAVVYDKITWAHSYSKSWFERVMWIRKKQRTDKPTEQQMEERNDYMIGDVIYKNTTKAAMTNVLQALSNSRQGEKVVCYKLVEVAVAYKPVEPKQVQWL